MAQIITSPNLTAPGTRYTVARMSKDIEALQDDLRLAKALLGGTDAMRDAGKTYLPIWPNEREDDYATRLQTSVLFPAYSRTVATLASKPFAEQITLSEDMPERTKTWCDDIDLQGRNLDTFAAVLMEHALGVGFGGILVDYPVANPARSQADEKMSNLRPYWVEIAAESILGFRVQRINNTLTLTQLRFFETFYEPDGEFGEKYVEQVKVLEIGKWRTYRKADNGGVWLPYAEGTMSLDIIPFVPVYGKRTGFMLWEPPLLELAHLNAKHWRSQSDQDAILHVARVPILAASGLTEPIELVVGASAAITLPPNGTLSYVEHSGAAIAAGKQSLDDLKEEMRQSGAELLVLRPAPATATEIASGNSVGMCDLQRITLGVQDAINLALDYTAKWVGDENPGTVKLFNDFGAMTLADTSAQLLLSMNQAGKLSDETLFNEIKRRGMVASEIGWEDEKDRLDTQGPPPGPQPVAA